MAAIHTHHRFEPTTSGLEVGDVLIAPTFTVTPADALDYERSAFVHQGGAEGLQALQRLAPLERGPGGCAPALVLSRAAGSVLDALGRDRRPIIVRSIGRLRLIGAPVLGERLTPTVTVRFVSRRADEHVTLTVEVRRRGGKVLATLEMGVQFARERRAEVDTADAAADAA